MTGADPEGSGLLAYNREKARFLTRLAWTIELVLVATGCGIAVAQATSYGVGSHLATAFPVFGVFVVLAAAELSKIPSATVAFHASGWTRALAAAALLVASLISFETVFNGFERFAYATTSPVTAARLHLADLQAEVTRLSEVPLSESTDLAVVGALDTEQRTVLTASVAGAEAALDTALAGRESFETRELRTELAAALAGQAAAVAGAGAEWDREQQSIERRLKPDSGIDEATRAQLQARMRGMRARQAVTDAAAARSAEQIDGLQRRIEASITDPSPETRVRVDQAAAALEAARAALADFESEAGRNQRARVDQALADTASARQRAEAITGLQAEIAAAERLAAEAAALSQMHRWASFFFGKDLTAVSDSEAKRVAAMLGAALAIAAALAGSITAVFAEWFRVRGVVPQRVEVPVEVTVEVEVPVEVKVPVDRLRVLHVPLPAGPDAAAIIDEVLAGLPWRTAEDLRAQLAGEAGVVALKGRGGSNAA